MQLVFGQDQQNVKIHDGTTSVMCTMYKTLTLALTAAADNAAAAATVTSLSAFLAVPDSSNDAGLSPPD